jgi:CTP synthase
MLLENGLQPDVLVLRTEQHIGEDIRRKVALFCNVEPEAVMESIDVPTIYEVPLKMHEQNLDGVTLRKLGLSADKKPDLKQWTEFVDKVKNPEKTVNIALVGKYTELPDAYKSISESFIHAGAANNVKVKLKYINSERLNDDSIGEELSGMNGILVGPGFGKRGIEGKIIAVRYAREKHLPLFGICLGMQCSVIEFARDVIGLADADTAEENDNTKNPVIDAIKGRTNGGPMRLGAYECRLENGSRIAEAYGTTTISERHRHRYKLNNDYRERFEKAGMLISATSTDSGDTVVEAVEIPSHPWFVAVQFHPEYKSTVENPHPLFTAFVKAATKHTNPAK